MITKCQQEIIHLEIILDKTVPSAEDSLWIRRKKALLSLGKNKQVDEIIVSLGKYVQMLTLYQAIEGPRLDTQPL